jgi:hypothetical protein
VGGISVGKFTRNLLLGAGLDAEDNHPDSSATLEAALEATEQFVQSGMRGRRHSPFWNFLDGLTTDLLGGPSDTVSDRWGWSNLLKIGWSRGNPANWPTMLIELQRNTCEEALRGELSRLRDSLIFVASNPEFRVLHPVAGDETEWNQDHQEDGIWWLKDNLHGNLYVHGYHPGHARRRRFYDAELKRAITLTWSLLSPFDG